MLNMEIKVGTFVKRINNSISRKLSSYINSKGQSTYISDYNLRDINELLQELYNDNKVKFIHNKNYNNDNIHITLVINNVKIITLRMVRRNLKFDLYNEKIVDKIDLDGYYDDSKEIVSNSKLIDIYNDELSMLNNINKNNENRIKGKINTFNLLLGRYKLDMHQFLRLKNKFDELDGDVIDEIEIKFDENVRLKRD